MAMAKLCGLAAVAVAIVAIFVPVTGILLSVIAVALAVLAALGGAFRSAAATSAIVATNSFLFSPVLWMTVMWPGQLFVAALVLFLVALPLGAIAVSIYLPRQRYAIALSFAWALAVPMAINNRDEQNANETFHQAERACLSEHANPYAQEIATLCYRRGKRAFDEAPRRGWGVYALAVFGPIALGWLSYASALWLRRKHVPTAQDGPRAQ
jgi:hypothetical protein